jgi:hypothetical protein
MDTRITSATVRLCTPEVTRRTDTKSHRHSSRWNHSFNACGVTRWCTELFIPCRQAVSPHGYPDRRAHLDHRLHVSISQCLSTCSALLTGHSFQTASNGVALLCIGRVVAGVAIGIASSIVPVYQAEIAPKEIRGRMVSLQQWAITW